MPSSQNQLIRLLALYRLPLLKIANSKLDSDLKPKESPSDLVQRTLEEATRDIAFFKGTTPNELFKWLKRMLRNNIADRRAYYRAEIRSVSRERSITAANIRALLEQAAAKEDKRRAGERSSAGLLPKLRQCIAQLRPAERKLIEWHFIEGRTYAKIAKELGKKEDAVRMACRRAFDKLRAMMDPKRDDVS